MHNIATISHDKKPQICNWHDIILNNFSAQALFRRKLKFTKSHANY